MLDISLPSVLKSQYPWPDKKQAVEFVAPSQIISTPDFESAVLIDQLIFDITFVPSSVKWVKALASTLLTSDSPVPSLELVN